MPNLKGTMICRFEIPSVGVKVEERRDFDNSTPEGRAASHALVLEFFGKIVFADSVISAIPNAPQLHSNIPGVYVEWASNP